MAGLDNMPETMGFEPHTHSVPMWPAVAIPIQDLVREVEEEGEERGWMACNVSGLSIKW